MSEVDKGVIFHQCTRKRRFDTRQEAQEVVRHMKKKYRIKFHAYRCGICGGYHVAKTRSETWQKDGSS